ncbi:hypothetical protein GCM10020331_071600 [Ectobacillus funiculus]
MVQIIENAAILVTKIFIIKNAKKMRKKTGIYVEKYNHFVPIVEKKYGGIVHYVKKRYGSNVHFFYEKYGSLVHFF